MNKEEYKEWRRDASVALGNIYSRDKVITILEWFDIMTGSREEELVGGPCLSSMQMFVAAKDNFNLYNSMMCRLFIYAPLILERDVSVAKDRHEVTVRNAGTKKWESDKSPSLWLMADGDTYEASGECFVITEDDSVADVVRWCIEQLGKEEVLSLIEDESKAILLQELEDIDKRRAEILETIKRNPW